MKYVPLIQEVPDYTQAQETSLASQMAGHPAGKIIIYNTTLDRARRWNGTAFEDMPLSPSSLILVSGTSIKTINNSSVLGAGNLTVSAGDPSYSPGSFTLATETYRIVVGPLKLGAGVIKTLEGTSQLRIL